MNFYAIGGPPPRPEHHVFATMSGTSVLTLEMTDGGGQTVGQFDVTVTSTPQTLYTLLDDDWDDSMIGARILKNVATDVRWNTSGSLDAEGVATVGVAPDSSSAKIVAGDFTADPYKLGLVA